MSFEKGLPFWPGWELKGKPLGRGSYGVVYEAVHKEGFVEQTSAIKIISIPSDQSEINGLYADGMDDKDVKKYYSDIVGQFVHEIQLMIQLKGRPNIVNIEDFHVEEKTDEIGWDIYIRMELLTPFHVYIKDKVMTQDDVIDFGVSICGALEACYQAGIIHRDIKRENIFFHSEGNFKLGDFGIARNLDNVTSSLSSKGTLNYIAPEVYYGKPYDYRVDIYSLGIVLYVLMNANKFPFLDEETNKSPIERKNAQERRMQGEMLPPPCNASDDMSQVILTACAYEPEKRFENPTALKNALLSVKKGFVAPVSNEEKTVEVSGAGATWVGRQNIGEETWIGRRCEADSNNPQALPEEIERTENNKTGSKTLILILSAVALLIIIVIIGIFVCAGGDDQIVGSDATNNLTADNSAQESEPMTEKRAFDIAEDLLTRFTYYGLYGTGCEFEDVGDNESQGIINSMWSSLSSEQREMLEFAHLERCNCCTTRAQAIKHTTEFIYVDEATLYSYYPECYVEHNGTLYFIMEGRGYVAYNNNIVIKSFNEKCIIAQAEAVGDFEGTALTTFTIEKLGETFKITNVQ